MVIAVSKLTNPSDINDVVNNFKKWLLKIRDENSKVNNNLLNFEIFNSVKNNIDK